MPTINTDFKISGEQEYRRSISEINNGLKVLNSEMRLTESQYQDNAKSIDALNAKNDVLERKILSQKEKVETLRAALRSSAEAYGESDSRTMKWQVSLNNAEAELNDLNSELSANQKAIENSGKSFVGLGDAVDEITQKLGINLPAGAQKAVNGIGKVSASSVAAVAGVAAYVAILVKLEDTFINLTKDAAAYADSVLTLSSQTSLSTETIQEFMYSSELLDVSFDTVQGSLTKLTNNMESARDGSKSATAAFDALGISVADQNGKLRDAETVFYEAIEALGQIENYSERDALAMDIFGKSAQDLNPLIEQGTTRFRELGAEAQRTGNVLSTKALESLGAVDDAEQRLTLTTEGLKNMIGAEFAPVTEKALTATREGVDKLGNAFLQSGITGQFESILESTVDLIDPLTELATNVLPYLNAGLQVTAETVALIADTAQVITGLLTLDFDRVKQYLGLSESKGLYSNQYRQTMRERGFRMDTETGRYYDPNVLTYDQIQAAYQKAINDGTAIGLSYDMWLENYKKSYFGYNASGNNNWRGGFTLVGENGPEVVSLPQGTRIESASESREYGTTNFYITIEASKIKELNDLVRIAEDARWAGRM